VGGGGGGGGGGVDEGKGFVLPLQTRTRAWNLPRSVRGVRTERKDVLAMMHNFGRR